MLTRNNNIYKVDSKGIGNKIVRLRVSHAYGRQAQESQADDYMIITNVSTGETLAKAGTNQSLAFNGKAIITDYSLFQNYPNPFNPSTTITYQLPQDGFVTLKIYDVLGNEVTTLVNEYRTTGSYDINFNASSASGGQALSSGVYIYSIRVNDYSAMKKLVLMK